jgi:hypothetical protein
MIAFFNDDRNFDPLNFEIEWSTAVIPPLFHFRP